MTDYIKRAEPIERISENTIVVKYADYEDIGRIILTNGDIFCKMFYEDARQNDDSDYDSLVPDEYKTEPSDLISRADVLKYPIRLDHYDEVNGSREFVYGVESVIEYVESLPSADAEPIVIRAKTFMRKEDFDKWAEDIKKQNKSIVCIPCDAEVVSADRPSGEWIEKGGELVCSVCGNSVSFSRTPKGWVLGKFCQSCGARMIPYKGGDTE